MGGEDPCGRPVRSVPIVYFDGPALPPGGRRATQDAHKGPITHPPPPASLRMGACRTIAFIPRFGCQRSSGIPILVGKIS